jgi:hypothetical protein
MKNEILGFVQVQAKTAARRVAVPAALALIGGLFVLIMVAGLFVALFFWLEPTQGPVAAALIVAAVALAIAILAFLPLMVKRSPPPPPPSASTDTALPQLVSLMARNAQKLSARQLVVAATLMAAALVISARGPKK